MAKDPKATDVKSPEESDVHEQTTPSKRIPRLYILLGLVALILFQTLLLALLLPSPKKVAAGVEVANRTSMDEPGSTYTTPTPLPDEKISKVETVEKLLGKPEGEKYSVQDVSRTDPNTMSGFSCSVFAVIKKSDETAFNKVYETKIQRIAQEIQIILRDSTLEERLESSLSTIRNRIKRRVSENFDIPYIIDIGINDPKTENM